MGLSIDNNPNFSSKKRLLRHIQLSFIFRFLSAGLNFYLIRLCVKVFSAETYGLWLTLLSLISWFSLFDSGIGHGLKNKLTEAIAQKDLHKAQKLISSAYIGSSFIFLMLYGLLILGAHFIPWNKVLHVQTISSQEIFHLISVISASTIILFYFGLVNQIWAAFQKAYFEVLTQTLIQTGMIVSMLFMLVYHISDIYYLAWGNLISTFVTLITLSALFFIFHRQYWPKWRHFDWTSLKSIFHLGINFLVIQIGMFMTYNTGNTLISHFMGPDHVPAYVITTRYFSISSILIAVVAGPLWPAITHAYASGDKAWLFKIIRKLIHLLAFLILGILLQIVAGMKIIRLWIGTEIELHFSIILACGGVATVLAWNYIFSVFLIAINKPQLQMKTSLFAAIAIIPLSLFLMHDLSLGVSGVAYAIIIATLPFAILAPFSIVSFFKNSKWA